MEIKTQSDLYFEKKQNTNAPVGLYVENQLEKARIGRKDPVPLHQSWERR